MVAISGGFARKPATEAMLMILPERRGIMHRLPTSWLRKKTASMLRLITLRQASCGYSSAGAPQVVPALLTRMSMLPKRFTTSSTTRGTVSGLARSPAMVSVSILRWPRCAAASSNSPCLRAVMAILAPISPRASRIRRPSPREPPVTSATLPDRSNRSLTPIGHLAAADSVIPTPPRGSAESAQGAVLERDHHVEATLASGEADLRLEAPVEHHPPHPGLREAFVRVGAIMQEPGGDG